MSETVFYAGKIYPVELSEGQTNIEAAGILLKKRDIKIDSCFNDALECLLDTFYQEFEIVNDVLYRVEIETSEDDAGDIFRATKNDDGSLSFVVQYYNGGCSLNEALEEAIINCKS